MNAECERERGREGVLQLSVSLEVAARSPFAAGGASRGLSGCIIFETRCSLGITFGVSWTSGHARKMEWRTDKIISSTTVVYAVWDTDMLLLSFMFYLWKKEICERKGDLSTYIRHRLHTHTCRIFRGCWRSLVSSCLDYIQVYV